MLSLDQLKESYQMLNEELSRQQIVNEQLMNSIINKCRTKIKKETNWILRWNIIDMWIAFFVGLFSVCTILFHFFVGDGLSFWQNIVAWVLLVFGASAFFVDRHSIKILTVMTQIDLSVQEIAAQAKRYKRWVYKVLVVLIVVLLVLIATYYFYLSTEGAWKNMLLNAQVIGGVIGMVFGITCGVLMIRWINFKPLKKIQDSCKELSDAETLIENSDKER